MNQDNNDKGGGTDDLKRAKIEAEIAKQRLSSTAGALQQRLKPGSLANEAWTGVKDKSEELADEALQAVKDRPVQASGLLAAILIFLAREPLWDALSSLFRGRTEDDDLLTVTVAEDDENYDLAAPAVSRSLNEGVSA